MKVKNLLIVFVLLALASAIIACSDSGNLDWVQEDGYKWAALSPGYFGDTGFEKRDASDTNINFENHASNESIRENRNFLNGSGVATADVDRDGRVDVYLAQLEGPNKLFKNMGGFTFKDITAEAGLAHEGYNSTGVVFADVNGDTYPDLLITSLLETNELYINDGNGQFTLKKNSGLGASQGSNTMALADIDNDGDLDLYISNYKLRTARDLFTQQELSTENTVKKQGDSLIVVPPYDEYYGIIKTEGQSYRNEYGAKDELYINKGDGTFRKITDDGKIFLNPDGSKGGLSRDWGLTAKFQDINGDRYPDLFVANDFWTPDRIWINNGDGTFKGIARNAIRSLSFSSMGVDFSDINRDGSIDLFVTEMLSANHQRRLRQVSEHLDPIDGRPQYNRNSLYLNRGDATFAEIANYSGVAATEWSWATNFLDVDLDGYEDLIITTGFAFDYQDIDTQLEMNRQPAANHGGKVNNILDYPALALPNKMLQNNQDLTFSDKSTSWGFYEEDVSLGMAMADIDNDGDADFVINRLNQVARVYENTGKAPRIAVQLKGKPPNTDGIGAKITLKGGPVEQQKQLSAGGSYVSGSQPAAFFAADADNENHQITVDWPDGRVSQIDSVTANRIYVINQSAAASSPRNFAAELSASSSSRDSVADHSSSSLNSAAVPSPADFKARNTSNNGIAAQDTPDGQDTSNRDSVAQDIFKTLFRDISGRIDHSHHEDAYTDLNVQPLLPVFLSEQGPGVSWIDYDRDGDDDLFVSSGKGGRSAIFENGGDAQFNPVSIDSVSRIAPGDQTAIVGWQEGESTKIITGSANFEQGNPEAPSAFVYTLRNGLQSSKKIPGIFSTTGPLAASDYDGDGDIDLFVGGSFIPGQYPRDAASRIFRNENGALVLDSPNSQKLRDVGLVSGAVFSDTDRDGDQDLILSRAWDSIMLFENRDGNFIDESSAMGLDVYKGWWNGVATGDFNNDGRPDIVATNIGSNSAYQPEEGHPLKLFYNDFDANGSLDIVDSYYDSKVDAYVPRRRLIKFKSVPALFSVTKSHKEYAESSVAQIFGQDADGIPSKEITTVEHMLLVNTESGFKAQPLPPEAQFTVAFHPAVADFNNDGNEDLFLSQNNFAFPTDMPRLDAGRGLLMTGDGKGEFTVMEGQKSGIAIYGEQRGASVSDFNDDRRVDLAVSQNEDSTKLFMNQTLSQGLKVRLVGPEENRDAIGSSIQLLYADGSAGPLREIQAGSGYRSQRSFTQILGLGRDQEPVKLKIRWFDGSERMVDLAADRFEYEIRY
jgi:hypothetical protein